MADSSVQSDEINQGNRLKYLDFVHAAAIRAVVCVSSLYGYAKENVGPLKPGVEAVEGTVRTVVGPVVSKFHDVPLELLSFVDHKVDQSVQELERHVPLRVKEASAQAYTAAQKVPEVARSVAGEVQQVGVVGMAVEIVRAAYAKCEPAAKGLYAKYEPAAEHCAVTAWRSLNRLPLFPQVAQVLVPTAAYWSERYNQTVCYTSERGYAVSAYLPLVPIERIAKVFGSDSTAPAEAEVAPATAAVAD